MTAGAIVLATPAAPGQRGVESVEALRHRDRNHEVGAGELDQPLHLALVVALARAAEAVLEQVVADQLGERLGALTLAVAADLGHRDLGVVVQDRHRHAAEEGEGAHVPVQEGFRGLARVGLDEAGVRLRQVHAEEVDLLAHAADHTDRLAEIHLGVAWRMSQGHKGLS